MKTYEIELRTLSAQATAVVSTTLPAKGIGPWLSEAYTDVFSYLGRVGIAPAGPPFGRFTFHEDSVDAQAGVPVSEPIAGEGRVVASTLPGGLVAMTTYHGPYDRIESAYAALSAWAAEHGYEPSGPHWEVYYTSPQEEPDPSRWRTDLVLPLHSS
ncbi:MAG TPA: GyrI-like domain-containing protein [Micromonosporaceae bacterium]